MTALPFVLLGIRTTFKRRAVPCDSQGFFNQSKSEQIPNQANYAAQLKKLCDVWRLHQQDNHSIVRRVSVTNWPHAHIFSFDTMQFGNHCNLHMTVRFWFWSEVLTRLIIKANRLQSHSTAWRRLILTQYHPQIHRNRKALLPHPHSPTIHLHLLKLHIQVDTCTGQTVGSLDLVHGGVLGAGLDFEPCTWARF